MTGTAVVFALLSGLAVLMLPRRWAALPLLAGACYMTVGQKIDLGPFTFTVLRIVIALGLIRTILRREELTGGVNKLDLMILAWGMWAAACSIFHEDVASAFVARLGTVYNSCGIYFLLRVFCSSEEDIVRLFRVAAVVLMPVALEMIYEQVAFRNLFSILGAVPDTPQLRDGRIRAFGPFAHPILAGSVGGVTLPLMIGLWKEHRRSASIGIFACVTMVAASASSGPVMSALTAVLGVSMWRFRRHLRLLRWTAMGALAVLSLAMNRPPYYVIQRLEVFGGSTGWYRSRLIESAFEHIDEWWLAGTDHTRHWMLSTNAINEHHTDIANHYLALCVTGGLPLLLLHLSILAVAFSFIGQNYADSSATPNDRKFLAWTLGCGLLAHAVTNVSISYFDQSFVFFYLTLAAIASLQAVRQAHQGRQLVPPTSSARKRLSAARTGWRHLPANRRTHGGSASPIRSAGRRVTGESV